MAPNLLEQLRNLTSPQLISKLSKKHEENELLLRQSIETGMCAVLVGLYKKIEDDSLYKEILETVSGSDFYHKIEFKNLSIESINDTFSEEGQKCLNFIFTNKKARISEMISNEICVKSGTAYAILNLSTMLILSYINKEKVSSKELSLILEEEIKEISNVVPKGLKVLLGISITEVIDDTNYRTSRPSSLKTSIVNFFSQPNVLQKIKLK